MTDGEPVTDWPQFQFNAGNSGHNPNGRAPRSNPSRRWQLELDDEINGSPIVVDGTVYAAGGDYLYKIDPDTGTVEWRTDIEDEAEGAPAYANGSVFVANEDFSATVFSIDAETGETEWQQTFEDGVESSVVVAENTLFVTVDTSRDDEANVAALKTDTGEVRWSRNLGDDTDLEGAPAVEGSRVFLAGDEGNVFALSITDGSILWRSNLNGDSFEAAPTVSNGVVYAVTDVDNRVHALEASDGSEIWTQSVEGDPNTASVAVLAGNQSVYLNFDYDRTGLLALDTTDGTERWFFEASWGSEASPAVVDGVVYAGLDDGLYAIDAENGTELWYEELDYLDEASPAVGDGTVYFGDGWGNLYAVEGDVDSRKTVAGSATTLHFIPGQNENVSEGGSPLDGSLMQLFEKETTIEPGDWFEKALVNRQTAFDFTVSRLAWCCKPHTS
ncbi:outer membrane protein assembly factor BamB family protein, partial [Haloparvum sp. AD34]